MSVHVVIYEQLPAGGGAYRSDLAGVVALGAARAEAAARIDEALSTCPEDLRGSDESPPAAHHASDTVAA